MRRSGVITWPHCLPEAVVLIVVDLEAIPFVVCLSVSFSLSNELVDDVGSGLAVVSSSVVLSACSAAIKTEGPEDPSGSPLIVLLETSSEGAGSGQQIPS